MIYGVLYHKDHHDSIQVKTILMTFLNFSEIYEWRERVDVRKKKERKKERKEENSNLINPMRVAKNESKRSPA